jgi:hypothetical protein
MSKFMPRLNENISNAKHLNFAREYFFNKTSRVNKSISLSNAIMKINREIKKYEIKVINLEKIRLQILKTQKHFMNVEQKETLRLCNEDIKRYNNKLGKLKNLVKDKLEHLSVINLNHTIDGTIKISDETSRKVKSKDLNILNPSDMENVTVKTIWTDLSSVKAFAIRKVKEDGQSRIIYKYKGRDIYNCALKSKFDTYDNSFIVDCTVLYTFHADDE